MNLGHMFDTFPVEGALILALWNRKDQLTLPITKPTWKFSGYLKRHENNFIFC